MVTYDFEIGLYLHKAFSVHALIHAQGQSLRYDRLENEPVQLEVLLQSRLPVEDLAEGGKIPGLPEGLLRRAARARLIIETLSSRYNLQRGGSISVVSCACASARSANLSSFCRPSASHPPFNMGSDSRLEGSSRQS
jgi:hypothetical protein